MMALFKVLVVIGVLVIVFDIGRCFGLSEARKIKEDTLQKYETGTPGCGGDRCKEDS